MRRGVDRVRSRRVFLKASVGAVLAALGGRPLRPPAEELAKSSPLTAGTPPRPRDPPGSIPERVFFNPYVYPADANTVAWRRRELGGSNGHGNARGVAAIQTVVACGGEARGKRLLSRATCERILEPQADGLDGVLGIPMRRGLGHAVNSPLGDEMYRRRYTGRRIAMWGGSGGSVVFNDLDARMTVAFVMNRHVEGLVDPRGKYRRRGSRRSCGFRLSGKRLAAHRLGYLTI